MDPARLVTEIQGVRAAFPDLDFLAPQGVLRVPVDHDGAVRLRLQVPGQTYFHLHAIEVAADDENWRSHASWRSSSAWTGTTGTAAAALFEAHGHHDAAFHTELETAPWVEVSFDRPVGIRHVTVHNVTSPNASRARGMQMLVAGADGSWQKVYDGRARVQLLRSVLAQQALYRLQPLSDETADLAAIVVDMGVGAYKRASNALQHLPWITDDERAAVRGAVNHGILGARSLEWTIHGVKRSFRYWSEDEKRNYVATAVEVVHRLRQLTPHVCFGFGAVLAVVRDGDLIPHDDDLDLIVAFEPHQAATLAQANQRISAFLSSAGYTATGRHLAHRQVARPGQGKKLDVFVGIFEGDAISWYPGTRGSLHRETMFPTSEGPMLGHACPLPRNPLQYLETVYGPGWRNPDPAFRHQWSGAGYEDIAGEQATGQ
ncbi:hypothetical protein [Segeticoccus rhizosphaerae]|uniref:hypothetical protein n=1 Tax=Segeticoccus rhizosphaerae TaxID=1104777 RepID=UPI001264BEF3|nr:hypothetical protein [Segeticoccus rhizosphaerae]